MPRMRACRTAEWLALKLRVADGVGHVETINGFAPDASDPGGVDPCVTDAVDATTHVGMGRAAAPGGIEEDAHATLGERLDGVVGVAAPGEALELGPHELRQRILTALLEVREKAREVLTYEHRYLRGARGAGEVQGCGPSPPQVFVLVACCALACDHRGASGRGGGGARGVARGTARAAGTGAGFAGVVIAVLQGAAGEGDEEQESG